MKMNKEQYEYDRQILMYDIKKRINSYPEWEILFSNKIVKIVNYDFIFTGKGRWIWKIGNKRTCLSRICHNNRKLNEFYDEVLKIR